MIVKSVKYKLTWDVTFRYIWNLMMQVTNLKKWLPPNNFIASSSFFYFEKRKNWQEAGIFYIGIHFIFVSLKYQNKFNNELWILEF